MDLEEQAKAAFHKKLKIKRIERCLAFLTCTSFITLLVLIIMITNSPESKKGKIIERVDDPFYGVEIGEENEVELTEEEIEELKKLPKIEIIN
jgi:hypothetical protein